MVVVYTILQNEGTGFSEVKRCYAEDDATQQKRQAIINVIRQERQQMPRTTGRPDKHTRRKLRDYGRSQGESE